MRATYDVKLAPPAIACVKRIANKKFQREVAKAIDGLAERPQTQGKPLSAPLDGLWSLRAARDRYRVIYEVEVSTKRVMVLLIGERKPGRAQDIYRAAGRLLRELLSE